MSLPFPASPFLRKACFRACAVIALLLPLGFPAASVRATPWTRDAADADLRVVGWGNTNELGWDVSAGDVNGDSLADLLVGAYLGWGEGGNRPLAGDAYVFLSVPGSPLTGLLDAEVDRDLTVWGRDPGDRNARTIATGDMDGDGRDDIALGAWHSWGPLPNGGNPSPLYGEAAVVFAATFDSLGDEVDLLTDVDVLLYGNEQNDQAGTKVAAGDLDGDGYDDVAVGCPGADGPGAQRVSAGRAYVLFGGPADSLRAEDLVGSLSGLVVFGDRIGDALGDALAFGDVNGDGVDDLVLGVGAGDGPGNSRAGCGDVHVIFGGPRGSLPDTIDVRTDAVFTVHGPEAGDDMGEWVKAADVDGDGIDDLLLGAPFADGPANGRADAGEVYVVFGDTSFTPSTVRDLQAAPADVTIYGADPGDWLGHWGGVGDLTGDGRADLAPTAILGDPPGRPDAGEVFVLRGRERADFPASLDAATDADLLFSGDDASDEFGKSVAAADLDGDGRDDLILGAPKADGVGNANPEIGEAYVFYGSGLPVAAPGPGGSPAAGRLLSLSDPAPNPMNPSTTARISLARPALVRAEVVDVWGRRVAVLLRGSVPAGERALVWNGADGAGRPTASGVYFLCVRVEAEDGERQARIAKLLLLR